jgi:hypothetical protein
VFLWDLCHFHTKSRYSFWKVDIFCIKRGLFTKHRKMIHCLKRTLARTRKNIH